MAFKKLFRKKTSEDSAPRPATRGPAAPRAPGRWLTGLLPTAENDPANRTTTSPRTTTGGQVALSAAAGGRCTQPPVSHGCARPGQVHAAGRPGHQLGHGAPADEGDQRGHLWRERRRPAHRPRLRHCVHRPGQQRHEGHRQGGHRCRPPAPAQGSGCLRLSRTAGVAGGQPWASAAHAFTFVMACCALGSGAHVLGRHRHWHGHRRWHQHGHRHWRCHRRRRKGPSRAALRQHRAPLHAWRAGATGRQAPGGCRRARGDLLAACPDS